MAMYAKMRLTGAGMVPLQRWRRGNVTITFGQVGEEFCFVQRSDLPWAAVFPAPLEREACALGDRWIRGGGWVREPVGELA